MKEHIVGGFQHSSVRAVCTGSRSVCLTLRHCETFRGCVVEDILLVGLATHAGENTEVVSRTCEGRGE